MHPHPPSPGKCLVARNGGRGAGGVYNFALDFKPGLKFSIGIDFFGRKALLEGIPLHSFGRTLKST